MGAQIIKRQAGKIPKISTIGEGVSQISYNSDGRLIVRYIRNQNDDTLIIFDERTSWLIKNFCQFSLGDSDRRETPW
jgi:hypothetical protein